MNVGLFYGGVSVEHEVSIITAMQVYESIKKEYNILNIYFSKNGRFYIGDVLNDIENYKDIDNLLRKCTEINLVNNNGKVYAVERKTFGKKHLVDLGFLATHGTLGEDGSLQGFLDVLGLPYTGSSHYGSTIGQDKVATKDILRANNFNSLKYTVVYDSMGIDEIKNTIEAIGYPVIIKPSTLGSSVGISFCHNFDELEQAVNDSFVYEHKLIVEELITDFEEVNCSVLGNYRNCEASTLEKIINDTEFLSFESKYESGSKSKGMASLGREVPANIADDLVLSAQDICKRAFRLLNLDGVVRFDLMIYNNQIYINEVNTIPGSLSYYLWEATGISKVELYKKLVDLAIEKKRNYENKVKSYDTNILKSGQYSGKKNGKKM